MSFKIIFLFLGAICTCAQRSHKLCHTYGCFNSSDTQLCVTLDGDEVYYANFTKEDVIWDSRIPLALHVSKAYEFAVYYRSLCKHNLITWKQDESISSMDAEKPEIIIYPRDEVIKEEENTLICFINHFFPPTIKIKWTKNDLEVSLEDPFIKCIPNPDGTFYVLSILSFVPNEGDIYGCTVEHASLDEPQTKFWEVDTSVLTTETSVGPIVFFGFASSFGLLGVATGTVFFVKGRQFESS
ncbi:H-2 class II histocompatibility antigen, A-Q alpha chain-like [Plectropomus leopardus]|uniref:H-2 class II histocompatibility antigen, A-Q alpha chain-like n=1 Tax=Plectropomus leopardus TaxID=160734 RepID=UPI001C4BD46F|nr:H-2 class II histocompatibility antigen, A-Q alpha chain-like [Plectropomus leopardus]